MQYKKNGYILDAESPTELARLITLDRAMTVSMGGIMAGIPNDLVLKKERWRVSMPSQPSLMHGRWG